jgi:hypothetical protein
LQLFSHCRERCNFCIERRRLAGLHLHRRQLAAAFAAEKSEDVAALDRQGYMVDGDEVAEATVQAVCIDEDLSSSGEHQRQLPALARRMDAHSLEMARKNAVLT